VHVTPAIGRNLQRFYGEKRSNPTIEARTEEAAEALIRTQTIRHNLKKLKESRHEIAEGHKERTGVGGEDEESKIERHRRQAKVTKRIATIVNLIEPEGLQEYFGTRNREMIWGELNTQRECRDRVIEWLDAMIATNVSEEIQHMNKRAHALKVQEAYRPSKGIAMKRFIDKKQSPRCQIETSTVTDHFAMIWASSETEFQVAQSDTVFVLETRTTDKEEMEAFVLDEKNIEEVIKSRQDLSACGIDGISYRILKAAGKEGITFIKTMVRACIKNGRIVNSWKEARTVLISKKGDRADIGNWRPISITNCIYRIFTCLLARAIQRRNIFAESKGLYQKDKWMQRIFA
jgi:hypothetical protein